MPTLPDPERSRSQAEAPDASSIQILLAEYAMLQASLKVSWDLTQQRTATFFTVLSATAVAVGLVVQASGVVASVVPFTLVALAIALFVGLSTFLRVVQALQEVTIIILGMNRIRRFMVDAAPRYSRLFSLPVNDDEASLHRGVGGMHGHGAEGMRRGYGVLQVPGLIAAVNAALAGLGAAVVATGLAMQATAIGVGVAVFAVVLALSLRHWQRAGDDVRRSIDPLFPSELPSTRQ
jgi:hypothetical protein